MQHSQFLMMALMVASVTLGDSESAKILGLFHLNSKSHFVMFESLLQGLARSGHEVHVVSHFPQKHPLPNYTDISLEGTLPELVNNFTLEFARNFTTTNLWAWFWFTTLDMCQVALEHPEFKNLMSSNKTFDLIITEIVGPDCFLGLKHIFNVPVISMTSSVAFPWGNDRFANPDNPAYIPNYFGPYSDRMSFTERFINTLLTEGLKIAHHYFGHIPAEEMIQKYFGKSLPPLWELQKQTSLIFVNSHYSLNIPRPTVPAFVEVGGLHIQLGRKLPKDLEKFINGAEHGVIYFCLGSLVRAETMPQDKLQVFIEVFKRLPQRVLWKIDNVTGLPGNVMTSKWMPQFEILSHPNVRVFMSHGGLMGTQEAVYAGVPIVGIPLFADQELNIRNCVLKGIAIKVDYDSISTANILNALNRSLNDPRYKENARRLSQLFRDRPQTPLETAIFWTEYVIRHKGAHHLQTAAVNLPLYQYLLLDVMFVIFLAIVTTFLTCFLIVKRILSICHGSQTPMKLKSN